MPRQSQHETTAVAKSDGVLHSRYGLPEELTCALAERFIEGCDNRLRRNVFADAEAAAKKSNVAFQTDGLLGDEHLRTAIGALHKNSLNWFDAL